MIEGLSENVDQNWVQFLACNPATISLDCFWRLELLRVRDAIN